MFWKAQQCDWYVRLASCSLVKSSRDGSFLSSEVDSAMSFWTPPRMESGRELTVVWETSLQQTSETSDIEEWLRLVSAALCNRHLICHQFGSSLRSPGWSFCTNTAEIWLNQTSNTEGVKIWRSLCAQLRSGILPQDVFFLLLSSALFDVEWRRILFSQIWKLHKDYVAVWNYKTSSLPRGMMGDETTSS